MKAAPDIVIADKNIKLAALLFDMVVSVATEEKVPDDLTLPAKLFEPRALYADDPHSRWRTAQDMIRDHYPFRKWHYDFVDEEIKGEESEGEPYKDKDRARLFSFLFDSPSMGDSYSERRNGFFDFMKRYFGNDYAPIFLTDEDPPHTVGKSYDAIEISLLRLPLIDADNLDWETIREIRNDPEFINEQRRFLRWFHENYAGKEVSYVKESLSQRMADHQEYCQKHNLQMKLADVQSYWDIAMLGSALGVTAAGIALGEPAATIAGLIGSTHRIGEVAFKISKREYHAVFEPPAKELGYIIKLGG